MSESIDQFGRTNKDLGDSKVLNNKNKDQSQKIKESLAEIKEQLIKDSFKIQVSESFQDAKEKHLTKTNNSSIKIKDLENKINILESEFKSEIKIKLNSIDEKLSNLHNKANKDKEILTSEKLENNIFFEINNQLTPLTTNALLVINKDHFLKKTNSPFIKIIYLVTVLVLLYFLSILIMALKDPRLSSLDILSKEYLFKFLELIKYIN